jgi:hypothetical protein
VSLLVPDLKLLFIMAPHTGCTAIGTLLRKQFGAQWVPAQDILGPDGIVRVPRKHTRYEQLVEEGLITPAQRADLTVAVGVRNPFDEEVSDFLTRERLHRARREDPQVRRRLVGDKPVAKVQPITFEEWLRRRHAVTVRARLRGRPPKRLPDWTAGADVVLHFEQLQADFDALMRQLGVSQQVLIPVVNRTGPRKARPYQEFYNDTSRQIVERVFADKLARFGYRFEPLQVPASETVP